MDIEINFTDEQRGGRGRGAYRGGRGMRGGRGEGRCPRQNLAFEVSAEAFPAPEPSERHRRFQKLLALRWLAACRRSVQQASNRFCFELFYFPPAAPLFDGIRVLTDIKLSCSVFIS